MRALESIWRIHRLAQRSKGTGWDSILDAGSDRLSGTQHRAGAGCLRGPGAQGDGGLGLRHTSSRVALRPALLIHVPALVFGFRAAFLGSLKVARAAESHRFSLCPEVCGSKQFSPSVRNASSLQSSPLVTLLLVSGSPQYSSRLAVLGISGHSEHRFLNCVCVNLYVSVGSLPSKSLRAEAVSCYPQ